MMRCLRKKTKKLTNGLYPAVAHLVNTGNTFAFYFIIPSNFFIFFSAGYK